MTLLEEARALLATGSLCDACLGRPVADRSFGLTNAERGRALRTGVALADDEPYADPDADCWVCEGHCARFNAYADRLVDAIGETELYTYQVGTRVPPLLEENGRLLREQAGFDPEAGEPLKRELNREVGRRVGATLGAEVDFERPDVQFLLDLDADAVEVRRNSVTVYGRYRKLERGLPQTEWDPYEASVEEHVAPPFLGAFRATDAVLHGAGREDVDALMVGTGRPFVLELKEPRRRDADLDALAAEVAGETVELEELSFVTHEMIARVKQHDATKTYRATVALAESVTEAALDAALADLDGATVDQRTPTRVDHRRADTVRERAVLSVDGALTDERSAVVDVHGEGGLYIKELLSGDGGRTEPSLAGLVGVDVTVETLDVLDVEGVDEPFLMPAYRRDHDGEPASPPW